jgi:hypothetical protein
MDANGNAVIEPSIIKIAPGTPNLLLVNNTAVA